MAFAGSTFQVTSPQSSSFEVRATFPPLGYTSQSVLGNFLILLSQFPSNGGYWSVFSPVVLRHRYPVQEKTCTLTDTQEVLCWGDNYYGQLGLGNTISYSIPQLVPGLSNVTSLSAGSSHTCALDNGGGVKCWGLIIMENWGLIQRMIGMIL